MPRATRLAAMQENDREGPRQHAAGALQPRLPKTSDVLADELRRHILSQGLQPGDPLPSESELIQSRRLSRASVREALRLLEAEGIIAIQRGPRGGVVVNHPDPNYLASSMASLLTLDEVPMRDLFDFRQLIEPYVVEEIADRRPQSLIEDLQEVAGLETEQGELAFHLRIAEAAGNGILRVVLHVTAEILRRHATEDPLDATDAASAARAHKRIAAAIADGDGPGAAQAMRAHLRGYERRIKELGRLDQPIVPRSRWRRD